MLTTSVYCCWLADSFMWLVDQFLISPLFNSLAIARNGMCSLTSMLHGLWIFAYPFLIFSSLFSLLPFYHHLHLGRMHIMWYFISFYSSLTSRFFAPISIDGLLIFCWRPIKCCKTKTKNYCKQNFHECANANLNVNRNSIFIKPMNKTLQNANTQLMNAEGIHWIAWKCKTSTKKSRNLSRLVFIS